MADNFPERENMTSSETIIFHTPRASRAQGLGFGEGDSDVFLPPPRPPRPIPKRSNKPKDKKFCNNVRIPVFEPSGSEDENENPADPPPPDRAPWCGKFPALSSSETTELMAIFKCPICQDYMVEATAASCGHSFCSDCLEIWTGMKPICPLCSKQVACRIRLYNDDLLIERMIKGCADFPEEVAQSLSQASKMRMDRVQVSRTSLQGRIGSLRDSVDEFTNSLRCKGFWQCLQNSRPVQAFLRYWAQRQYQHQSQSEDQGIPANVATQGSTFGVKFVLFIGILIGACLMWVYNRLCGVGGENFLYYLYLCVTKYDGSIPDFLKMKPNEGDEDLKLPGGEDLKMDGGWWSWLANFTFKLF